MLHHRLPASSTRADHFDLLLEWHGKLLTWELLLQPLQADHRTFAARLPDHRLFYLDYSGPLSDDRGQVQAVAAGQLRWETAPDSNAPVWVARLTQPDASWRLRLVAPTAGDSGWVVEWQRVG